MKKFLSFVVISFFLLGILAFAKDSTEGRNNNENNNRQQILTHTGTELDGTGFTKEHLTGTYAPLSTGAIACATTAIVQRDATIRSWMDAYHASWTISFNARTIAFTEALSLGNRKEMKKAMDLAWKTSEKAMKTAQKVKKEIVHTAWNTYRVDLKACNADIARALLQERGGNDLDD